MHATSVVAVSRPSAPCSTRGIPGATRTTKNIEGPFRHSEEIFGLHFRKLNRFNGGMVTAGKEVTSVFRPNTFDSGTQWNARLSFACDGPKKWSLFHERHIQYASRDQKGFARVPSRASGQRPLSWLRITQPNRSGCHPVELFRLPVAASRRREWGVKQRG